MMNKLHVLTAALYVAVCGCVPEAVTTATVESVTRVCVFDGRVMSVYGIGAEQHALLKDEFEAWKQAGFEGFDDSFVSYAPTLLVMGKAKNGVSYKIDFGEELVMVNEVRWESVDGSQYSRIATAADNRFRQFLTDCIVNGKLPLLARGRLPNANN